MCNIIIKCIPQCSKELKEELKNAAENAASQVKTWFNFTTNNLEIEIYSSRQEWIEEHTRLCEKDLVSWVAGDSGRIIRVVAGNSDRQLLKMTAHECVHHIIRAVVPAIPAWLDEGLAILLLHELPDHYQETLKLTLKQDALLPLEVLTKPFSILDRSLKSLAYAQSYSLVEYLEDIYGREKLRGLLISLGLGETLDHALRPMSLNRYLLEKEWERWVREYKFKL